MNLLPEWSAQDAIMLTWPHTYSDWTDNLNNIEEEMLKFAKTISLHEKLLVVCFDIKHKEYLAQKFTLVNIDLNQVIFAIVPSNDRWARDHGPLSVLDDKDQIKLLDFQFNGWGQKYKYQLDNAINATLKEKGIFSANRFQTINVILEGGSIEVNAKHELLTTSNCLLSKKRNNFTKEQFEKIFTEYFGVQKTMWLDYGYLAGDDTDSHIDTLARFISDNQICYVKCDDPTDQHFVELQKMEQQLQSFTNIEGQKYQLIPLPWPKAQFNTAGQRLPLTYANFLIINDAVLVPNYADPADKIAEHILKDVFPDRTIIGIASQHIIREFGSLHCLTMQLPKGVLP